MAFDLILWKWAAKPDEVHLREVVEALNEDNPHPALTRFEREEFESAIRAEFGDVNEDPDSPFLYEISDFTGVPANWVHVSVKWSQVIEVCPRIVETAKSQGLAVFDPQENTML